MKGMKVTLAVAASALLLAAAPAMAFHSGGVAECDGCHTMHNSDGGATMNGGTLYQAGPFLLQTGTGGQASDACLNCHENTARSSYHISTTTGDMDGAATFPNNRTPGGDFGWLKLATGHKGGHNVLGTSHGFSAETKFTTIANVGPGGSYPANQLQCSSCHDPHGKYRRDSTGTITVPNNAGNRNYLPIANSGSYSNSLAPTATAAVGVYRILGGVGYLPKSMSGSASLAFLNGPPAAVAPSTYNASESVNQTKVAYGAGMSEWCANCHKTLLDNAGVSANNLTGGHTHPAGAAALLSGGSSDTVAAGDIAGNYNAYVSSGNLTGTSASSYESLVPYEENSTNYTTLQGLARSNAATYAGPAGSASAMCLSCHRAHATGFESMLRYDISSEFMTAADSAAPTTAKYNGTFSDVNAWKTAAYNDKPATRWGLNQRVLCNKCHAKD
jgi:hypothetical protein